MGASPVPDIIEHDITTNLISQRATYVSFQTMSLDISETNAQYAQITPLLKTSADSYGKINLQSQTAAMRRAM